MGVFTDNIRVPSWLCRYKSAKTICLFYLPQMFNCSKKRSSGGRLMTTKANGLDEPLPERSTNAIIILRNRLRAELRKKAGLL